MNEIDYSLGCCISAEEWAWLNRVGVFEKPDLTSYIAPFPPQELMYNVSGLQNQKDFASHGVDLFQAYSQASPIPLTDYQNLLDFGCGCGRLARMFKGHPHKVTGCDIDSRHIKWINDNLAYMTSVVTSVHPPLPFSDHQFDGIIANSVFTHLNENSQDQFLSELHRICIPNGYLLLSIHGARALERSINEKTIRDMISVEEKLFQKARSAFDKNQYAFILQQGHLTTSFFEYGITFIPESYIRNHWNRWFEIVDYCKGAIHSWQDIVVLKPLK
ncbi:MAG: class I SAM-dependent methyltransferase [Nostoc sp. NMS1]|uniref:class I SAM-dependent methyltransferase n=1 Tax=Nostoc sp. NMS1 TaxID=2815388 RepID=UPI0025FB60AE|nr:class I SAM-dependent methyltransferase [Nostoc sp. NMS1]MBN3906209.1 class I SAM-dependent methyltransferase [Nostoc sp. NMS1]